MSKHDNPCDNHDDKNSVSSLRITITHTTHGISLQAEAIGAVVGKVMPGSQAETLGVPIGARIVSIDGEMAASSSRKATAQLDSAKRPTVLDMTVEEPDKAQRLFIVAKLQPVLKRLLDDFGLTWSEVQHLLESESFNDAELDDVLAEESERAEGDQPSRAAEHMLEALAVVLGQSRALRQRARAKLARICALPTASWAISSRHSSANEEESNFSA